MSTLHVPDGLLNAAGINEAEALVELAIHLFETQRLSLCHGARLAGLTQAAFEDVLLDRGVPIYRFDEADLDADLHNLRSASR